MNAKLTAHVEGMPEVIVDLKATPEGYLIIDGGGGGAVNSINAGTNVTITGPASDPIVNVPSIGVETITAGTNITITGTATNPIINATAGGSALAVTGNASTDLSGTESVILTGVLTLPADTTGRVYITGEAEIQHSSVIVLGENGGTLRLYIDGALVGSGSVQAQYAVSLSLGLTGQTNRVNITGFASGIAAGAHTIQLRAVKIGAVGTASVTTADQRLYARQD